MLKYLKRTGACKIECWKLTQWLVGWFSQLIADHADCHPDEICDFELQVCDTQQSVVGGAMKEFIFSGRLDNLCMSFCALKVSCGVTHRLCAAVFHTTKGVHDYFDILLGFYLERL